MHTLSCTHAHDTPPPPPQDDALFNRLCPADRDGARHFAPVMLRRLAKLGIDKVLLHPWGAAAHSMRPQPRMPGMGAAAPCGSPC